MNRIAALDKLSKHFTDDDLLNIAFELDATTAVSEKSSHNDLVRDLLNYCLARGTLDKLAERCASRMPDVDWRGILLTQANSETLSATVYAHRRSSSLQARTRQIRCHFSLGGVGLIALLSAVILLISQLAARPEAPVTPTATMAGVAIATDTPQPAPTDTPQPTAAPSNTPALPTETPVPTTTKLPTPTATNTPKPVVTRRATRVVVARPSATNVVLVAATATVECANRALLELSAAQVKSLGCPVANRLEASDAGYEVFQNGSMLWVKNTQRIYVFTKGRTWSFGDAWDESQSVYTCRANEAGVPSRGFGKVWCSNSDIQTALGLVSSGELADVVEYQTFERGIAFRLRSAQRVFIHTTR